MVTMLFTIDSLPVMRHGSASSSTSDVSSIPGNLASLRTDRSFSRDVKTSESQLSSTLSPSWTSGHMTYPGRRSGSNESDRISDVSQRLSSAKGMNKFSVPRTKLLADSGSSGSPIIAHHIASPPENRRPITGIGGSVMALPSSKARTLSSESSGFGSMARQRLWDKKTSKERSSLDSTTSEQARHVQQKNKPQTAESAVEHEPARAKPFLGRANTVQLPMPANVTKPSGTTTNPHKRTTDKSPQISENSRLQGTKIIEEQKVLKDIDNTIEDMTKALNRDIHGLSQMKGKSFDSQVTPIALHTTDSLNLATTGSTKEERIFKYKQARRKELAKIANQGKSKSMELPDKDREKYLSEMESHTPKFSRKYGSKESLEEGKPTTFTSIAVRTEQIVMPSPILPKSVISPLIATVSPIMIHTSSVLSSSSPGIGGASDALTTVVPSHSDTRLSISVAETTIQTSNPMAEVGISAFKPVKASSPTKIIPTSTPLDQLSGKYSIKETSPVSPIRIKPEISNVMSQSQSVPVLSSEISPSETLMSIRNGSNSVAMPTSPVVVTTQSSLGSLTSPTKFQDLPTNSLESLRSPTKFQDLPSTSIAISVLPKSSPATLLSSPIAMVTSTLTTSMATTVTATTASLTSPLTSIRSASNSDLSSVPKRHILKKQQNVEETDTLSGLKQFVMTPAAIAQAERKLSKSKSETSMSLKDHDPKQFANAYAEKTFLEKSRRTSKDIEKWEDLIMNVADMQQELENIEFKIKQANNTQSDKGSEKRYRYKVKHSDKTQRPKELISKISEHKMIKEEKLKEEMKQRESTSPGKQKNENVQNTGAFDIDQLIKQETSDLLQNRKKLLQREDSFNRPDSPIREPMPLPKESVIKRNRLRECGSSSSSEGGPSPQRSPRVSPRVHRRKKPHSTGGSMHTPAPSNMLTVEHAHVGHTQHREAGGRRDPNR